MKVFWLWIYNRNKRLACHVAYDLKLGHFNFRDLMCISILPWYFWRYISEPLETPVKFGWKFKICINVFKSVRKIDARSREAGEHSNYRGREHFLHCTLIHGLSTFYHHLQLWTRRWLEPWRCAPAHLMNIVTWSSISDNLSLNIEIGQRIGKARFELITSRSRRDCHVNVTFLQEFVCLKLICD